MMLHAFRLKLRGLARMILVSRACLRGVGMRLVMRGRACLPIFGLLKIIMMKHFMRFRFLRMLLISKMTGIIYGKRMIIQSLSVA